MKFELDERLHKDCHLLGEITLCRVLLNRNAGVPWFILVPQTDVIEIVDLSAEQQSQLLVEVNLLSEFIRDQFDVTKLNVAAIGNIVSQLHVHVIGRHPDDYCWPDVVWGTSSDRVYSDIDVTGIKNLLATFMQQR